MQSEVDQINLDHVHDAISKAFEQKKIDADWLQEAVRAYVLGGLGGVEGFMSLIGDRITEENKEETAQIILAQAKQMETYKRFEQDNKQRLRLGLIQLIQTEFKALQSSMADQVDGGGDPEQMLIDNLDELLDSDLEAILLEAGVNYWGSEPESTDKD